MSMKSFKNEMTFANKGQIFILYDEGKTIEEISEITNYSPNRLRWVIEGCSNTNAWFEAKDVYREVENYSVYDKGHRDKQRYIGWENINGSEKRQSNDNDKKPRAQKRNLRKAPRGIGGTRDEIAAHQSTQRQISQSYSRSDRSERESANSRVQGGNKSRRPNGESIINGMRKHKDYVGE